MKPPNDPIPHKKRLITKLTPAMVKSDTAQAKQAKKFAAPGTKVTMTPGTRDEKPVFHFESKSKKGPLKGPYGGSAYGGKKF